MKKITQVFFIFLFLSGFTFPVSALQEVSDLTLSEVARQFAQEIDCKPESKDLKKAWCVVTTIEKGDFVPPSKEQPYVGLSMEWIPTVKISETLSKSLQTGALYLGPTGVRLTSLKPSDDKEAQELATLRSTLESILKGENRSIQVSPGLSGFLKSELQKPKHPYTVGKKGASFTGSLPSKILRVKNQGGEVFVVLEQGEGGIHVSIFPIKNL